MFAATTDDLYPDPFHRIASSFAQVENPASVVCSVARGYMFGARVTAMGSRLSVGRLKWTHGALDHDASLGFLMSDVPSWRAARTGALRPRPGAVHRAVGRPRAAPGEW